jgi:hypothetical protein
VLAEHERRALPNPLAEGWRVEYVLARNHLRDLEKRTGAFSTEGLAEFSRMYGERVNTSGEAIAALNRFCEMQFKTHPDRSPIAADVDAELARLSTEDWRREVKVVSRCYSEIIRVAELPYSEQMEANSRMAALREGSLVLSISAPTPPLVTLAVVRATATRRGRLCLAAVRRWELLRGTPPPDLSAACKAAGLASVPIDPFSGEPMRITLLDGKPVVYSVGPDGRDDGARLESTDSDKPGDVLFRIPTRKQ